MLSHTDSYAPICALFLYAQIPGIIKFVYDFHHGFAMLKSNYANKVWIFRWHGNSEYRYIIPANTFGKCKFQKNLCYSVQHIHFTISTPPPHPPLPALPSTSCAILYFRKNQNPFGIGNGSIASQLFALAFTMYICIWQKSISMWSQLQHTHTKVCIIYNSTCN